MKQLKEKEIDQELNQDTEDLSPDPKPTDISGEDSEGLKDKIGNHDEEGPTNDVVEMMNKKSKEKKPSLIQ